jgi:hypothetical protein
VPNVILFQNVNLWATTNNVHNFAPPDDRLELQNVSALAPPTDHQLRVAVAAVNRTSSEIDGRLSLHHGLEQRIVIAYIVRRVAQSVLVLLGISLIVFVALH